MAKHKGPIRNRPGPKQNQGGRKILKEGVIELPPGSIPSPSLGKSHAFDFSQALLQGNPVAIEAANRALRDEQNDPSLADLFIASTHISRHSGKLKKILDDCMMQYRLDMRHTHRFVLDDEFVEYATLMSNIPAEKLLARLQYATLPYEQTWIEFNLRAKVRVLRTLHKVDPDVSMSEIAPRLGCLLQRINDTDAICTMVSEVDGKAEVHMTCYFYSVTDTSFRKAFGCLPMPFDDARLARACLWGYTGTPQEGMIPGLKEWPESIDMKVPVFLESHGVAGLSRMHHVYSGLHTFDAENFDKDRLTQLAYAELREFTGHMRWMVTVLAMLNEVPVRADLIQRQHQKLRLNSLRKHTYVDYHKVSLKLPKTKPIPYLERHLAHSDRKHKAHEVRAFWRTYLHDVHCPPDRHEWVYDHKEGYRLCGRCMAYGRFIHEHVRGNPELGWVRKDYVIGKQKTTEEDDMQNHDEPKVHICSVCNEKYTGLGNNARPINDGRCCDICNSTVVIPARLEMIQRHQNKGKQ